MTLYGTVIADKLNIRSGPGTSYADVGDLFRDDKLEASESMGGWWKLTKVTRGGVSPIINLGYASTGNGLYIREDAPPTPEPVPAVPFKIDGFDLTLYATDEAGNKYKAALSQDGLGLEWVSV